MGDEGCVEYKLMFGREHSGEKRLERISSQMKFRLAEGGGRAFYLLGICDSGTAAGLAPEAHADTVRVLMQAATAVGSVLLLETIGEARRGGRRCSAWRAESWSSAAANP